MSMGKQLRNSHIGFKELSKVLQQVYWNYSIFIDAKTQGNCPQSEPGNWELIADTCIHIKVWESKRM